jgi:hypothetical protein
VPERARSRARGTGAARVAACVAAASTFGCSSAGGAGASGVSDAGRDVAVVRDAGGDSAARSKDGATAALDAGTSRADASSLVDAATDAGHPDVVADAACTTGLPDPTTAPATLDTTCFTSTFDDAFNAYDISSGPLDDGMHPNERWFNGTDQCCMSPSNGWPGVMYPTASQTTGQPVNPYSLLPGGGLQISLQESNSEWFSGVMTSVDGNGNGFAQAYGYFEMNAQLPPGTGTWPSFWMLSLPMGAPGGEIDVFEQLGCSPPLDPAVERIFHFTLHDWAGMTTPAAYTAQGLPDLTAGYHRYGLLWNRTYMALYLDGALLFTTPTPSVMVDVKYYLLADLGIGSGWVTTQTPNPSNLLIQWIRAYSVPGF